MDRYIPVASCAVFYSCLSALLSFIINPPKHLSLKEKKDFIGWHVSMVHSLTAIISSFTIYFYEEGIHYNDATTFAQSIILGHTVGYMVYDTFYSEIFDLFDWSIRIHHLAVLIGGFILLAATYGGSPSLFCIIVTEMSNPFMITRLVLRAKRMDNTQLYAVAEVAFAVIFLVNRCFIASIVIYNAWVSNISFIVKMAMSTVHGVGIFWAYVIISMLLEKFQKNKNFAVKVLLTSNTMLKRNTAALVLLIVIFSFIVPYFLTSILKTGYINISYGNFIII